MPAIVTTTVWSDRLRLSAAVGIMLLVLFFITSALLHWGAPKWLAVLALPVVVAALLLIYRWDQWEDEKDAGEPEEKFFDDIFIHAAFGVLFLYVGGWCVYGGLVAVSSVGFLLLIGGALLVGFGLKLIKNFA